MDVPSWKASIRERERIADGRKLYDLRRDFNRYMLRGGFHVPRDAAQQTTHCSLTVGGEIKSMRIGEELVAVLDTDGDIHR